MTKQRGDWDESFRAALIVLGCAVFAVALAVFGAGFALGRWWS